MELYPTKSYVAWGPAMGKAGRPGEDGQDGASIVGPEGPIGPAGPGTGAGAWQPETAYTAGQVVQAPDGSMIARNTTSSSRPSFDATEEAAWTAVSAKAGTIENKSLSGVVATVKQWARDPESLWVGAVTRDGNGAPTSAGVVWPDGATGVYTATTVSASFPPAVDAFTVTRVVGGATTTYTQPAVNRDGFGNVVTLPEITVA